MSKRILVIDSGAGGRDFFALLLKYWSRSDASLSIWSANAQLLNLAREQNWQFKLCRKITGQNLAFAQVMSLFWLKLKLLKDGGLRRYDAILLYNWPEKAYLSPLIKRLGIRLIWLEDGASDYLRIAPKVKAKLLNNSADAKVLVINQQLVEDLTDLGYYGDNLRLIPDCALPVAIPSDLAQNLARHFKLRKDYFTIGAKLDWQDTKMAENLIKSLQLCLDVSPHFQLVLIGGGPALEQVKWLVKRWHLETQVWLVGERPQSERWLEGFAAFVIAGARPDWDDLSLAVTAIAKNITVIGRHNTILDQLLDQELGRLVVMEDNQVLAQTWLTLYHEEAKIDDRINNFNKNLVGFEALADKLLAII
jgi:hypothetical protein